jgi:hypothetical protein
VTVNLPTPRDQIATRELPEFAHLRAEVSRLVRGVRPPAAGSPPLPGTASAASGDWEAPGGGWNLWGRQARR